MESPNWNLDLSDSPVSNLNQEEENDFQWLIGLYDQEMSDQEFLESVVWEEPKLGQSRFAKLTDHELDLVLADSTSKNTNYQTSSHLKVFKGKLVSLNYIVI